ncbi:succinylglutamate desuccinylase [Deltaproteobacteria bacterium Smac51]|nr:succinylglutamate desuccinylase [Deltaproteobacteria bacterium Smac51]
MISLPAPGLKRQDMIDIDGLPALPVTSIRGLAEGPVVLVVSGVHGAEYVAIQALMEVAGGLEPSVVRGGLIMIHPVNPEGFRERRATVLPKDGRNINSLFYDDTYDGPAARIARFVAGLQSTADFYLDLHTADLFEETAPLVCYPATGNEEVTQASRQAALVVDAPLMIKSSMAGAGITEAAKRGLPALLIKRGGIGGACPEAEVDLYRKDIINVLTHLGVLAGKPILPARPPREVFPLYLRSARQGVWRPSVSPGQAVAAGQLLGVITDFFGHEAERFMAEKDGQVLYGLTALSASEGDILLVY